MPCSAKLRSCVDDLIAKGKPESSAWAICRSQLGESRHPDFEKIHKQFLQYEDGENRYLTWIKALGLDENSSYMANAGPREKFQWIQRHTALTLWKEDKQAKYWKFETGFPVESMNGNIYTEEELKRAARTLKGQPVNFNHKNALPTCTIEASEWENGVVEGILRVPNGAVCPKGTLINTMLENKQIYNNSLEAGCDYISTGATCEGMHFTGFALLSSKETLPGIPYTRLMPLESIMVEALQIADETQKKLEGERKVTKIEAKIKEYTTSTNTPMGPIPPLQRDESPARGHDDPVRPVLPPNEPKTVLGTPAAPDDQHFMKSGPEYGHQGASPSQPGKVVHSPNPTEANEPKAVDKGSGYAPTSVDGSDGGIPKPEDIRSGPSKNAPPKFALSPHIFEPIEEPAPLPTSVVPEVELGKNVVSRSVPVGSSPVERLPSLEERVARVHAEFEAKSSEEKALAWEQKHNEIYEKHIGLLAQYNELNRIHETLRSDVKVEREQKNQLINNLQLQKENAINDYNRMCGDTKRLEQKLETLTMDLNEVNKKYHEQLNLNLELSNKLTKTNEDYLELAKEKENAESKLQEARDKAKKIVRISV